MKMEKDNDSRNENLNKEIIHGYNQGVGVNSNARYEHYNSFGTCRDKTEYIGGYCICPKCGMKQTYKMGERCCNIKCPKCGCSMVREELYEQEQ